jgi:hypothetical protein
MHAMEALASNANFIFAIHGHSCMDVEDRACSTESMAAVAPPNVADVQLRYVLCRYRSMYFLTAVRTVLNSKKYRPRRAFLLTLHRVSPRFLIGMLQPKTAL